MIAAALLIVAGLLLLTAGADRMVLAAARLSQARGLSPVLVGALIVGLGTSMPELLVSAIASVRGDLDLAVGNIVGSNASNVTLVLGASALVAPLVARSRVLAREGVVMLAALAALTAVLWDLEVTRVEAGALAAGMVVAAILLVRWAEGAEAPLPVAGVTVGRREVVIGGAALVATVAGADVLVRGAERLVEAASLESGFVGLVVVAVGTSLPELATSVAAALRGEAGLVVGNVIGSNLFNSLAVAGVAGLFGPGPIDGEFRVALLWMLAAVGAAAMFVTTGPRVVRAEAVVLLGLFGCFVVFVA